ncbi:MAG: hypothetical protein FJ077_02960 [Cyanobacteria bacterium K_DeepCast_35m_m2_023]|nr:hypothetical protein [Cyanobacteria bacterium K_DeepCast_35m_m2_023]
MQYGPIIQNGAKGFGRNAVVLVGFSIAYAIVLALLVLAGSALNLKLEAAASANWGLLLVYGLVLLLQVLVHLIGNLALINGGLMAACGQTFRFGQLFAETRQLFNLLGLHVFAAIAILLGLLAFGIPGIYLSVGYWFAAFVLVDRKVAFLDAMSGARRMVTPHWFDVAALLVVIGTISAVGVLALGVGLFATVPLAVCIGASAYLQLSGH